MPGHFNDYDQRQDLVWVVSLGGAARAAFEVYEEASDYARRALVNVGEYDAFTITYKAVS